MQKKNGFTLIELLVAISIIAILSIIGMVSYSTVSRQGRDSKRQSDLRSIQSALEQYYRDQGFYPTSSDMDSILDDSPSSAFTSSTGNPSPPSPAKTYLNSLPQDPTNPTGTGRYIYEAYPISPACSNSGTETCTTYCLYARIENPPSPVPSPPTGCTYPSGYNFVLTLP